MKLNAHIACNNLMETNDHVFWTNTNKDTNEYEPYC